MMSDSFFFFVYFHFYFVLILFINIIYPLLLVAQFFGINIDSMKYETKIATLVSVYSPKKNYEIKTKHKQIK